MKKRIRLHRMRVDKAFKRLSKFFGINMQEVLDTARKDRERVKVDETRDSGDKGN